MTSRSEKRLRIKGRQTTPSFAMLPHQVLNHENFRSLSPRATKLAIDLVAQYKGHNNGDLCAPFSQMKERGWRSSDQLNKAKKELIARGIIKVSRQGGLNKASLYAATWFPINECGGKLDIAPTRTAPGDWKKKFPSPQ